MKEALKLARDWIAERPADRPVSAGKMISIIDRALAKDEQSSSQEPDGPIADGWCINFANGHSGMGVYAHMDDYPEEGAILLCGVPKWAIDALAQPNADYERGFIDGMSKQAQSSVDKAVNAMTQPSNFCPRCGKRRGGDVNYIHTCTPPRGLEMT